MNFAASLLGGPYPNDHMTQKYAICYSNKKAFLYYLKHKTIQHKVLLQYKTWEMKIVFQQSDNNN